MSQEGRGSRAPAGPTTGGLRRDPDRDAAEAERTGANRRLHFLHPGQVFVSRTPCAISTVLGSCVSICLWDRRLGIGGMNHFVLPYHSAYAKQPEARFSNVAVERLLAELLDLGGTRDGLQAKIFGGACVLASLAKRAGGGLGAGNIEAARKLLAAERIPIVAEDVGGNRGRRLIFYTDEGSAFVRLL